MKTLLALTGALLLAAPVLHAQQHHVYGGGNGGGGRPAIDRGHYGAYHGGGYGYGNGYGHHGGWGRNYYYGGIPYFLPFYDVGFGYPYYGGWYGGGGYGYGYGPDGASGGENQGRIAGNDNDKDGGDRPPSSGHGPSLPLAVQRQLAKKGYYKGSIDGEFGPASRSALSRFQHDNDLRETGRIDEDTLDKLGFTDHQ